MLVRKPQAPNSNPVPTAPSRAEEARGPTVVATMAITTWPRVDGIGSRTTCQTSGLELSSPTRAARGQAAKQLRDGGQHPPCAGREAGMLMLFGVIAAVRWHIRDGPHGRAVGLISRHYGPGWWWCCCSLPRRPADPWVRLVICMVGMTVLCSAAAPSVGALRAQRLHPEIIFDARSDEADGESCPFERI